tara:strand:+ start:204 stop:893 length:690 start_codon:yes stop_codon:yes gene_type:complete
MASKLRLLIGLLVGLVAWYAAVIAADYLLVNTFEIDGGLRYALLGAFEFVVGGAIVLIALRLAGMSARVAGFTWHRVVADAVIGLGVAVLFAALQFLVIIPATGGAARSDIVANAAQLGDEWSGLAGFAVLALLGSSAEEMLFRGLLLGGFALLFSDSVLARILATIIVAALFAFSHGYQGWAGIVDTGLYGGLTLSLLYWWRGKRLAAPIAAHVGWNLIASVGIFLFY